jgi:2-polyprenyl-3-methyl-5-hydroxy-6-metoxy-1,4-benzoquinol methylase
MGVAYGAFLPLVPEGGRILDAGCGSGRDSERFLRAGYAVEAFDASARMARCAGERTGLAVRVLEFSGMDWDAAFDGVFANASLLHVPPGEMGGVLERIAAALRPGGVLFASLKHGEGGYVKDGVLPVWRYDEAAMGALVDECPGLGLVRMYTVPDSRPGRGGERWLHCLARRGRSGDGSL